MTEVRFYHLQRARLEEVLPVILERCHQRGERVLVLAGFGRTGGGPGRPALGPTGRSHSCPHGTARDGEAARQPIFLAPADGEGGNPNNAPVMILSDGARHPQIGDFKLVCELFDGHDEAAVAAARAQWRTCKEAGHAVVYFQQAETGKWQETARA